MAGTARSSPALAPTCTAVWGAGLLLLFLLNRRYDVAYLPGWLAEFGRTVTARPPVGASGLLHTAGGLAVAGLIGIAWWGLGSVLGAVVVPRERLGSRALDWSIRGLLGAAAWSTIWFFLGVAGLYRTSVAAAAAGVGVILAARAWRHDRPEPSSDGPRPPAGVLRAARVLLIVVLGLALIAALAPATANDALMYHLALPKAFVGAGALVEVRYNMATYFPLGVEMHAVWAMLLGRPGGPRVVEAAAGATLWAFALLMTLVTYGWARARGLDRTWSTLAALTVASIPTVYFVSAGEGVDVAVAAYSALALLAAGRWWATLEPRWLALLAAGVAGALSAKLSAVALVVPLVLALLLRGLRRERAARRGEPAAGPSAAAVLALGLGALAAGAVLASPWYVRTWSLTGSPLFPFYSGLWPGQAPGWDAARAQLLEALMQVYGRSAGALDYVLAPFSVSLIAQPELPRHYEGVLGPAFLLGTPLVVWAAWRRYLDAELRLVSLIAGAMFVLWLMGSQVIRYLLPATPPLAVAIAAAATVAATRWGPRAGLLLRGLLLGAALVNALVIVAWFFELDPLPVVLGGETRERFLERRVDSYPYYEVINRDLPPGARVWLISTQRDTYYLERPYFADYFFGTYTLAQWVREARGVDDLRGRAREAGITHLLVRHDHLFDYAASAVVDDRLPRATNLARLEMLRAFLVDGTRLLRGGPKFWLIELGPAGGAVDGGLPSTAPPGATAGPPR